MSGHVVSAEEARSAERFVEWFNALGESDRVEYRTVDHDVDGDSHDVFADWVNQESATSTEDYDRVTELHSMGFVEIGDDARAYFRR